MAPTTAIAEMALVSDISGVCSSRDTRRMTSRPMNVASISTNNPSRKSNCIRREILHHKIGPRGIRSPSPFVALQHRNFRLLWTGQLISFSGSNMQTAAILWHVSLLVPPEQRADRARHGRARQADADHLLLDRRRHGGRRIRSPPRDARARRPAWRVTALVARGADASAGWIIRGRSTRSPRSARRRARSTAPRGSR